MSFSYFDFSPAPNAFQPVERAEDIESRVDTAACVAPSENVWLEFNAARDERRDRLEEVLRFMDGDGD